MRLLRAYEHLPAEVRGAAVAIGNFDGVHLGHRAVIGEAGRIAEANCLPWAVLTFEPHPRAVFQPTGQPFRLSPAAQKAQLIEALGPHTLFVIPFDMTFSRLSAHDFVERVIVNGLGARHVICGHDFAFGHGRQGSPELLLRLGDELGFDFTCVQEVRDDGGEPYSSSRIRRALAEGDLAAVTRLLGRPFVIEGEVTSGDQRGRTLGFPTANIALGAYQCPAKGVYAVRAHVIDGMVSQGDVLAWDGVANIGQRPTFGGQEVLLEVHLFDVAPELYGRKLCVQLIDFIRPERKFDGLEALRTQIGDDKAEARRILKAHPPVELLARAGNQ
ncbi:MAG: bifunctional riboflavin kinase/FAD synthetase [Hyphomicrobiales bacterium]|nr:bifunctional riboflavin kinase/FAD synthetase [Hyphomicrobiales bacterium]